MKIKVFLAWVLCFTLLFSIPAFAEATWLEEGWGWITEKIGLNPDSVKESILGWVDRIEAFSSEIKNNPEVQSAWNTLKEAALQAGSIGKEAVTKAYHTVLNWWLANGEEITEEAASALDGLAKAAGVEQAEIAEWYSAVEEYIAENKDTVTAGVKEAWDAVKQAGTEVGEAAREKLSEAYQTIQAWLEDAHSKEAEDAREAFGKIVNL